MNYFQIIQDKFVTKVLATIFGAWCKPLYIGACTMHRRLLGKIIKEEIYSCYCW